MAITVDSYPVETVGGQIQNAKPGFKPIEIIFKKTVTPVDQADVNVVGLEAVIVDPDDDTIDLLGFSLYSDFGLDQLNDPTGNFFEYYANVDVSLINDTLLQEFIFDSEVVEDSRVKFRVKYRLIYNDGTIGGYTTLSSQDPIICVYSTKDFALDTWLTPADLPKIWRGYPLMCGFIHSDANDTLLDIVVYYDLIDITGSIISGDLELKNYGSGIYGLMLADLSVSAGTEQAIVPNAGGYNTSDWINPDAFNCPEFWERLNLTITETTIVSVVGFQGNALQVANAASGSAVIRSTSPVVLLDVNVVISFKYRYVQNTGAGIIISDFVTGQTIAVIIDPEPIANDYEVTITLNSSTLNLQFSTEAGSSVGDYFQIDEVNVQYQSAVDAVEYIDFKIVSE